MPHASVSSSIPFDNLLQPVTTTTVTMVVWAVCATFPDMLRGELDWVSSVPLSQLFEAVRGSDQIILADRQWVPGAAHRAPGHNRLRAEVAAKQSDNLVGLRFCLPVLPVAFQHLWPVAAVFEVDICC
jgi:hypothetical protein